MCRLHVRSLADSPQYETVSYVWNTSTPAVTVSLNNVQYQIPASAAAALRRLRFDNQPRLVWIDAICINQDDLVERGEQVILMRTVYTCSMGNLIYLGESDNASQAVGFMNAIYEEAREFSEDFDYFEQLADEEGDIQAKVDWSVLQEVICNKWFRLVSSFHSAWFLR